MIAPGTGDDGDLGAGRPGRRGGDAAAGDPAAVERVAAANTDQLADGRRPLVWHPMSLNEGYLGIALLHSERGDRDRAHAFLSAAARTRPARHALLDGLPALLFTARAAATRPGDYASLLSRAEPAVRELTRERAAAEHTRLRPGRDGVEFAAYDIVEGLAGLGRLVLEYGDTEPLSYLIALTEPIERAGTSVPGWLVTHAAVRGDHAGDGHFNLGLAHGVPGPLALLAIAYGRGLRLPGHAQAMERVADWLLDWVRTAGRGRRRCRCTCNASGRPHRDDGRTITGSRSAPPGATARQAWPARLPRRAGAGPARLAGGGDPVVARDAGPSLGRAGDGGRRAVPRLGGHAAHRRADRPRQR